MTVIENYLSFLHNLDTYKLLPSGVSKRLKEAFERGKQDINEALKLLSPSDPTSRREDKIARYKYEKTLEQQLRQLESQTSGSGDSNTTASDEEDIRRELYLKSLQLYATKAIGSLEMLQMELTLLRNMPKSYTARSSMQLHGRAAAEDTRQTGRQHTSDDTIKGYTERLETLETSNPLLDKAGKVMRPFNLVATRDQVRKKAFGTGQYMPTMSVEEYLEEERKQGGIISGGGPQSEVVPEPNEDDEDIADMATYKARDWDEFVEANPKGSGNTMNKG
ncbi:TAP42-domain-containing protein [Nadsonia fulvescens var. elongata DSM 6958]|uniref:TAP42-domain-containing protein n=1 Tax=Nadsonia fulvescens var. elongata DSM 6958 TaxID=857566 RepID=A0A1E3PDG8_9ASCO|nr:TAP42-domain-containing protein [Nadsonia fulvescens var. elongata DSM 6958]